MFRKFIHVFHKTFVTFSLEIFRRPLVPEAAMDDFAVDLRRSGQALMVAQKSQIRLYFLLGGRSLKKRTVTLLGCFFFKF